VKDVRGALREYEADLVAESVAALPDELVPEDDVLTLAALAERHGVSEDAIESTSFPEHERVGRMLVRPAVLAAARETLRDGLSLSEAETALEVHGLTETSAVLSRLDYRVEWEGLGGGTVRTREGGSSEPKV
jgi:hypothetical protein